MTAPDSTDRTRYGRRFASFRATDVSPEPPAPPVGAHELPRSALPPAPSAVMPLSANAGRKSRWRRLARRAWHRLLTPGWLRPSTADRLRGWHRVLDWDDAVRHGYWRYATRRAAMFPWTAWREAGRRVEQVGRQIEAESAVPPAAQRRQVWWLAVRHGLNISAYTDFQLFRPERRRLASSFVQEREHTRLLRWLHHRVAQDDGFPLADKAAFERWCRANDVATVAILFEVYAGRVTWSPGTSHVDGVDGGGPALPPCDLFSKPTGARAGIGTARWTYRGDGRWTDADGVAYDAAALVESLVAQSMGLEQRDGYAANKLIVQPCLRNHPGVLPLTPGALSTVRVLTFRPPGGDAAIALAGCRMPVGRAAADNVHQGGIVARVDVATGRLGVASRREGNLYLPVPAHPDTGTAIEGFSLPCWDEVCAAALGAFAAAHTRPAIGWDIAITDRGVVIVEGNMASDPHLTQLGLGQPLGDSDYPRAIDAHLARLLAG